MEDDVGYERARQRVQDIKGFYHHLIWYIIINLILLFINLLTTPGSLWFYWVTVFWGIGLVAHALSVFSTFRIMDKEWEERKIN